MEWLPWLRLIAPLALSLGTSARAGTVAGLVPAAPDPSVHPLAQAPSLAIARSGSDLVITFSGSLLAANTLSGPWTPLTNAVSPWTIPASGTARYFHAREAKPSGVFDSDEVLDLTLRGPFQPHFELAFAGLPDGIFPPVRLKPYFPGSVLMAPHDLPIDLRVRGNSSLQECPFPKLKLKVSREARQGTPFADAREINIATHCAEGGEGPVGRLRHETATFREGLAYEAMATLGFTTPRVRRARIHYVDTTDPGPDGDGGWILTRKALLIENVEVLGERLGGRALSDEEIEALRNAKLDPQLIADLRLLHALLGNWDYALSLTGEELWNTAVIAFPDGRFLPVAGDFDLASWVTAVVRLNAPHDYHPELPDLDRETRFQVDQVRASVDATLFDAAKRRFLSHRAALGDLVRRAEVDDAGRANATAHLDAFWSALDEGR